MEHIIARANTIGSAQKIRPRVFKTFAAIVAGLLLLVPGSSFAAQDDSGKALILYYSRSGKSAIVAQTLQNILEADLIEIKDLKDRDGTWGFIGAALDSYNNRHTDIEPRHPDLSPYEYIFLVTPIWNWKLCVPMRTLLHENSFEGKKLVVFTTANIDIKKYAHYGDDAPYIKRFLRDYLNDKRKEMAALAASTGADIADHFHLETKEKTPEEIQQDTINLIYKASR